MRKAADAMAESVRNKKILDNEEAQRVAREREEESEKVEGAVATMLRAAESAIENSVSAGRRYAELLVREYCPERVEHEVARRVLLELRAHGYETEYVPHSIDNSPYVEIRW
jgi:hypothetical protein